MNMNLQDNYTSSVNQFYDANEGFTKGSLSKTIYKPYKNYKPKEVVASNEKEALMLFIQKCDFAIQDLTLYLDIQEKDEKVLKMLNFYKDEFDKAKKRYLEKYGPVTDCQITDTYKWNDEPFPWERG